MANLLKRVGGGGGGSPIVETGSFASPQNVTTNISVPVDSRARIFVKGASGAVSPTISDGSGVQELHICGTSDTNTVEMNSAANLSLSGSAVLRNGSYLLLHWIDAISKWIEVSRNEI